MSEKRTGKIKKVFQKHFPITSKRGKALLIIPTLLIGLIGGVVMSYNYFESNYVENIATYKGGSVTTNEVVQALKGSDDYVDATSQLLIYKVYEKLYSDLVTTKEVNNAYNNLKEQDSSFETTLTNNGYTEDSYKEIIKKQMIYEKAIKKQIKVKNNELEEAFTDFVPEIDVRFMTILDENLANEALDKLNNGDDFKTVAKEYSQDSYQGKKVTYKYNDTYLPSKAITEANSKEVGEYFKYEHTVNGTTVWFIIKVEGKTDKGDDYTKYKSELTEIVKDEKAEDSDVVTPIIKKDFKKANVEVSDSTVKSALKNYLTTSSK